MRVTTSTMFKNARTQVAYGQARTEELRTQLGTGQKFQTYGGDPEGADRVNRQRTILANVETNKRTISHVERNWSVTEQALSSVGDMIFKMREIATQFANDTYTARDRATAADEVAQIRDHIVGLANTTVDGRYVFAGVGSSGPPYDAAGVYSGDTGRLMVQVTSSAQIPATLVGGAPFVDAGGGPSLFDTLDNLEAALRADDATATGNVITEVIAHEDRLLASRQQVGHHLNRLDVMRSALERVEVVATATMAEAHDTDFVSAMVDYKHSEESLRAALMLTSRLEQLSLLNFV